jgi:murein DD-endopeptidase MepM/ murein hydrolase activator NlpD
MRLRVLFACLLAPIVLWGALPLLSEGASTQGQLNQIESKIGKTKARIGATQGKERVLTTDISAYTRRINVLQARVGGLAQREARLQSDLDRKVAELDVLQGRLRAERARLLRLRARLEVARAALSRRLVEIYQADKPDLITVVLNSNGFADLLERGDFLRRISESDRRIVAIVRAAKKDSTESAARLAVLERRQQAVAAAVLARRQEVTQVKVQVMGTRDGVARARAGKQAVLARAVEHRHNLEGELTALVAEEAKVQAALSVSSRGSNALLPAGAIRHGSGSLIWPVNGPITSPFCERRAWESCHPGIDIGVPSGTPVRAAAAGQVALVQSASSSGGYGNFICVQHTGSMATCYAHLSSFNAMMGQSVAQGQVIGISGCTGRCFGPHLHFEVRINGSVTNPMAYL